MKLFNSKTNQVEEFIPMNDGEVSMYVCGPTVYDHAHIGNARPIVVFDLLKRVLEEQGYRVHYVSNFTDIDDKIIEKALKEKVKESELSQFYINAYNQLRQDLNADNVDSKPTVTENMNEIIKFIQRLIDEGVAYEIDGNVYFRINTVDDYGSISNQDLDSLVIGSRIERNKEKENPLDFVLWKKTNVGITWRSPWSKGRPGWHTECVVMIHEEFKHGKVDIHGGGQDLKFPHHENESAQNKAIHHEELANYWVHNAMLNIDGEKMSKSLGNVRWAKDFIKELGPNVTRWLLLSTHYRLVLNITDDVIEQSKQDVHRILDAMKKTEVLFQREGIELDFEVNNKDREAFMIHLYDDLNIGNAIKVLFDQLKILNVSLRQKKVMELKKSYAAINFYLNILGIDHQITYLDAKDLELFEIWEAYKKAKEFDKADIIRTQLMEKGYL